jgi:hypothetical protein
LILGSVSLRGRWRVDADQEAVTDIEEDIEVLVKMVNP